MTSSAIGGFVPEHILMTTAFAEGASLLFMSAIVAGNGRRLLPGTTLPAFRFFYNRRRTGRRVYSVGSERFAMG